MNRTKDTALSEAEQFDNNYGITAEELESGEEEKEEAGVNGV